MNLKIVENGKWITVDPREAVMSTKRLKSFIFFNTLVDHLENTPQGWILNKMDGSQVLVALTMGRVTFRQIYDVLKPETEIYLQSISDTEAEKVEEPKTEEVKVDPKMQRVMFFSDCNGYEAKDPIATLVEIPKIITADRLARLQSEQVGVGRMGGSWQQIMKDGDIDYTVIDLGTRKSLKKQERDLEFTLTSGNY